MNRSEIANDLVVDHLRPLRCFVAVADELHFGRAAERLLLPQSTVSEQVKKLELELGGQLFIRTSRRVALSGLGDLLLPEARRALAAVAHAYQLARDTASTGVVPLHIAIAADIDAGELAHAFPLLRASMPALKIVPSQRSTADQIEALLHRRLHVGFVWEPPSTDGLEHQLIGTTGIDAFVPDDHTIADREQISLEELCEHPLVLFSSAPNPWVRQRFSSIVHDAGLEPLIAAEGFGYDGQVAEVLAGAGVGVTARSITATRAMPGIAHVPVISDQEWRRGLIWHHDETHPALARLRSILADTDTDTDTDADPWRARHGRTGVLSPRGAKQSPP